MVMIMAAQFVKIIDEALGLIVLGILLFRQAHAIALPIDGEHFAARQDVPLQAILAGMETLLHQVLP
jgi:hypothetical protein